jgi:hypothetical protein
MQLPQLEDPDRSAIPAETDPCDGGPGMDGFEPVVEHEVRPGADEPESGNGRGADCWVRFEEAAFDECDRSLGIDPGDCAAYISRGDARYHLGDSECEADYRTAFFLDPQLTRLEIVRRLNHDIWDDAASVLRNCRDRLSIDSRDIVARIRLGLTLLMFHQDDEALHNLQQVFRQSPPWRPLLRLLVNEVKRRRATMFARILRRR